MQPYQFTKSQELFARSAKYVPNGIYGHQSPAMLVRGAYPYFYEHGQGSHVWDVDLSRYCKAIANGYALSAAVGRDALRPAAERVFFTGSYFTSAVPMAAALACLKELQTSGGIDQMWHAGTMLCHGWEEQGRSHGLPVTLTGPPSIPFMSFKDDAGGFKRNKAFGAACAARGVYLHPHHNWFLSTAHSETDIRRTLDVTDEAFKVVQQQLA